MPSSVWEGICLQKTERHWIQTCKTGDHPYSDPSPNGECSLQQLYMIESMEFESLYPSQKAQ